MKLHREELSPVLIGKLAVLDCWLLSFPMLDELAKALFGYDSSHAMRSGKERGIIVGIKFGASADRLAPEFTALAAQVARLRAAVPPGGELLVAAFFHLRFQNIHPLRDGNGRLGRLLLAEQCRRAYGVPVPTFLAVFHDYAEDYRQVFAAPQPAFQFELMVDLLARLLGIPAPIALGLPGPLSPVYPERNTKPAASMPALQRRGPSRSAFF
jgi:hypothetical protein